MSETLRYSVGWFDLCEIAAGIRKRIRTLEKEILLLRQQHRNCVWAMEHFSIESYTNE
jgi:hypothetical protein